MMTELPQLDPQKITRVVLVEDDSAFSDVLTGAIQAQPDFEVIACFESVNSALACKTIWARADLVLLDYHMPGLSGVHLVGLLKETYPGLLLVMMTSETGRDVILDAIKRGASGYITKDAPLASLMQQLRFIREGGAAVSPKAARFLLEAVGSTNSEISGVELSHRELQILNLINEGHVYKEVSDMLSISHHTVHSHLKRIYKRLNVKRREDALRRARALGLL
ncbi:MAG: response regulator transcription factor [Opitutales bacterium]|jgi:DNA-binding NarL/FixJ family response regulator|nr:response regulator transcription factor [Opitutales bacterium]MDP4643709.1 response regulator transcription factor [Opitutales bacterium]MDP4777452.1 response regulator transcription factor [Opitutales bacterium]MDP4884168.1 response regulator transcription factor [Opitutales bacterium]MDP5079509.1 response regulator transcription factor [Opitutales bacterium]